jgi:hypothetical protein
VTLPLKIFGSPITAEQVSNFGLIELKDKTKITVINPNRGIK